MNASSLYSMRIIGEQTSPLADAVQCSKSWQQTPRCLQCQHHDAAGLPDCRRLIERGQSRPRELPLGVRHVWPGTDSRVAQSCSAGHELLILALLFVSFGTVSRLVSAPAPRGQASPRRGASNAVLGSAQGHRAVTFCELNGRKGGSLARLHRQAVRRFS